MNLFSNSDPDPDADRLDPLRQAQAQAQEAQEVYEAARNRRTERQERLQALEANAREAEAEAERTALIPGGGTATKTAAREATRLRSEISELADEEDRARGAYEDAEQRVREVARGLIPELAEQVVQAREQRVQALADLGRGALKAVAETGGEDGPATEADEALRTARSAAKPSHTQERTLDRFLNSPRRSAPPEAELGYLIWRVVKWLGRCRRDDVQEILREHGVRLRRDRSLAWGPGTTGSPPIAREDAVAISEGRPLPL